MKVKIKYFIEEEKEVEIAVKDYVKLIEDGLYKGVFPEESFKRRVIINKEQKEKIDSFMNSY